VINDLVDAAGGFRPHLPIDQTRTGDPPARATISESGPPQDRCRSSPIFGGRSMTAMRPEAWYWVANNIPRLCDPGHGYDFFKKKAAPRRRARGSLARPRSTTRTINGVDHVGSRSHWA
jgi:hypothetical protein